MSGYRRWYPAFWDSKMRESFGEDHRLVEVWLWLIASESSSSIGIFRPNMRKLATEAYLSGAADAAWMVAKIASDHPDSLRYDSGTGYVWVVNSALRQHDKVSGADKRLKSAELRAEVLDAAKSPFWGEFLSKYTGAFAVLLSAMGLDSPEFHGSPSEALPKPFEKNEKPFRSPSDEPRKPLASPTEGHAPPSPAQPPPALPNHTYPGPAHEPAPARESIEGPLSISRSQLEAEIAESGAERGSDPDPKPLVAAGPLHPRTPAKTVDELLEGIEFPGDFDNAGEPMPELPFMKSVDKRPLAERLPEMFGGLKLDVPPERLAEAEAYDASRKADAEVKAATIDPEDAAFEEALATWVDLYSLDERAHKLIKRSVSEIPQGLEGHHEACRQACATIGSKYAKAVSVPLGMPAKVAIMRAVLLLVEDGRVSVPGAVDRLNTMLDWWTATDGNPKRRGDDGKDWFADAIAVFGGKETLQAASGNPRDAGSVLMGHLNASAAWKHARDRKLDVSKDPFAATGAETYYGIGEALKRGDWGVKQ